MRKINGLFRNVGALFGAVLLGLAFAQSLKPQLSLEGFLVRTSIQDGKTIENFEKAGKVEPGQLIEYRVKANNPSDALVNNLVVDLPIPRETAYLEGTATNPGSATLMASFDNKRSFGALPLKRKIIRDGKQIEEIVKANEFTHLRWVMKTPLKPKELFEFKARVKVK